MLFNSTEFLIFFPIIILIYYAMPKKMKNVWLLLASYYFYMCWNAKYVLLILAVTLITYISGLFLEGIKKSGYLEKDKLKKIVVALSLVSNLAILFYFKYTNFALSIFKMFLLRLNIDVQVPQFDIILPVGISFYTFQALSYTIDVYRDEIYAEKNFLRYALFVSFFPQLVAGPIERSKNLIKQLAVPSKFNFEKAREGLFLMLWGYFLKIVLADRIAIFVDFVYGDYNNYAGAYLILATMLFAVQIYCDFSGYSTIAIGAAKILGIELMENFDAPYLSTSVAEFWRKWHISLTSWFKDYLYIPLGGSHKGKIRKYLNKLIIFLISGLWHGATVSFVVWGGLNGIYQIIGEMTMPIRDWFVRFFHLNRNSWGHRVMQAVLTFVLVDFSWIFFRATSVKDAIKIIKAMFSVHNLWIFFDGSVYNCGLDQKNYWIMILGIIILLFVDYQKHKGIKVRFVIIQQDYWFRWMAIDVAIIVLLVFGIWGSTYDVANFIYFQF